MDIKELIQSTGWTIKQFALYFGIPQRTVENWIYRKGSCPSYMVELMKYKLFKEEKIIHIKITFKMTMNYDPALPDCGFSEETDDIVVEPPFDMADWFELHSTFAEFDGGVWFVIDESGERTGEAYMEIKREHTDEELRG